MKNKNVNLFVQNIFFVVSLLFAFVSFIQTAHSTLITPDNLGDDISFPVDVVVTAGANSPVAGFTPSGILTDPIDGSVIGEISIGLGPGGRTYGTQKFCLHSPDAHESSGDVLLKNDAGQILAVRLETSTAQRLSIKSEKDDTGCFGEDINIVRLIKDGSDKVAAGRYRAVITASHMGM